MGGGGGGGEEGMAGFGIFGGLVSSNLAIRLSLVVLDGLCYLDWRRERLIFRQSLVPATPPPESLR